MTSSKTTRFRVSSFTQEKPGLFALLFRRSFVVGLADYIFHFGLYGSIITGALLEITYLLPALANVFNGLGWKLSWSHGVVGVLLLSGGLGFIVKYVTNPYFRVAWGRIFYLDLLFMAVVTITGSLRALTVFGLMPADSTFSYPLEWAGSLHVLVILAWILASLLYGGAVRHALATVVWRFTSPLKRHALFMAFSNACGRCGRCVEV
jgi:hypothetical protein